MKLSILRAVLLCLVPFLFYQCSDKKNSVVGLDLLQRENSGSEQHAVFQVAANDTFFQSTVSTGKGLYLFFGNYATVEAKTLIRFDTLTTSGTMDSLVLTLKMVKTYQQTAGNITVVVSALQKDWNEQTMTWNTFDAGYIGNTITTKTIASTDTFVEMTLPKEWAPLLVRSDSQTPPYGILLTTDSRDGLVQTSSLEYGQYVELKVYVNKSPQFMYPVQDVFIAASSQRPDPDRLVVADGTALRSVLRFNVGEIPKTAVIGRALLSLHIDESLVFPSIQSQYTVLCFWLNDSLITPATVSLDSTKYAEASVDNKTIVLNVTSFVQSWTSGFANNEGMLLGGKYETTDLAGLSFYSSRADSLNRPSLDVFYTLPPSPVY